DTPVEVLHTTLLGTLKWLMRGTIPTLNDEQKGTLVVRIDNASYAGFVMSLRGNEIVKYVGSLIGRDLKVFFQIAPFLLHGLVAEELMSVWQAMSELSALAYASVILDLDEYVAS
ncbi:uncharacterized protein EV422DRAFT_477788, partial [Fimicolochytrium jonesii]|uniref:uncharacterized protein n=1 Tax=Fimicolochytrium jonesii TaxID=1396493 RepID=UPI0022FEF138